MQFLKIVDSSLNPESVKEIGELAQLQRLMLTRVNLDQSTMDALGELPNLRVLEFSETDFKGISLNGLAGSKTLMGIALFKSVVPASIADLANLKTLRACQFIESDLRECDLLPFSKVTTLQSATFTKCQMNDSGWAALSKVSQLKQLALDEMELSNEQLEKLLTGVSPQALALPKNKLTAKAVGMLAKVKGLEMLILEGNDLGENAVPALCELDGLRLLVLSETNISKQNIAKITKALPQCQVVSE